MSFLARIASRAVGSAAPGKAPAVLRPKGLTGASARKAGPTNTLSRQEEEEEARSLRRQEEEEEEAQPLRRQEEEEEEVQALQRQEEEEEAQPLRRQVEEEEEEAQALRRQEEEEEAQTLRRLEDDPSRLDPENSPPPDEVSGEPEPPTALAIRRRETGAAIGEATASPPGDGHQLGGDPGFDAPSVGHVYLPEAGFAPSAQSFERPSVTIEQLDVVIHEPAPARTGPSPMQARSRAVRARLLRRL